MTKDWRVRTDVGARKEISGRVVTVTRHEGDTVTALPRLRISARTVETPAGSVAFRLHVVARRSDF